MNPLELFHTIPPRFAASVKRQCVSIEQTLSDLETLGKSVPASFLKSDACVVAKTGNQLAATLWKDEVFHSMPDNRVCNSAHDRLLYEEFCETAKSLFKTVETKIAKLSQTVLSSAIHDKPRWIHPTVSIWQYGLDVHIWLRNSHFAGVQTHRGYGQETFRNRPIPRGMLTTAVLLACKAKDVGAGSAWNIDHYSEATKVQAGSLPSALAWFAATQNHDFLHLLDAL